MRSYTRRPKDETEEVIILSAFDRVIVTFLDVEKWLKIVKMNENEECLFEGIFAPVCLRADLAGRGKSRHLTD